MSCSPSRRQAQSSTRRSNTRRDAQLDHRQHLAHLAHLAHCQRAAAAVNNSLPPKNPSGTTKPQRAAKPTKAVKG